MKTKLITTKDYLLLIDEEAEIKEGDYLYDKLTSHYAGIHQHSGVEYGNGYVPNIIQCKSGTTASINCSLKVIAYYPLNSEAEKLDLPKLPNPFENNNEIGGEVFNEQLWEDYRKPLNRSMSHLEREAFIEGYKAAQSKTSFTLEDVENILIKYLEEGFISKEQGYINPKTFLQSLSTQQTYPKEFIPEIEIFRDFDWNKEEINHIERLKTTTNSEGKEVLVGTYKY